MKKILVIILLTSFLGFGQKRQIDNFKITILSTMLSDSHLGEWGFAALIEVDGEKILFDTGSREKTVIQNARELNVDLNNIQNVYLSHNHKDHTGGLMSLKEEYTNSFSKAHIGKGIFYSRPRKDGTEHYLLENKAKLEKSGVSFITHETATQILPKVWTTGYVPRIYDEKNWSRLGKLIDGNGNKIEDTIPEDQSLFFDTKNGVVLVSGCGHAGLVNTLEHVSNILPNRPIYKIIGGFHLLKLSDEKLKWTTNKMNEFGVKYFVGAHCTGINSTYTIRDNMNAAKEQVLVGSVGTYITQEGITPGYME